MKYLYHASGIFYVQRLLNLKLLSSVETCNRAPPYSNISSKHMKVWKPRNVVILTTVCITCRYNIIYSHDNNNSIHEDVLLQVWTPLSITYHLLCFIMLLAYFMFSCCILFVTLESFTKIIPIPVLHTF